MLYSGLNILPRSVFWSANFNGRSDNTDVIPLNFKTKYRVIRLSESENPTYRRKNAQRNVRVNSSESGAVVEITLASGATRFCISSAADLYDLLTYMRGPDSKLPFTLLDENGLSLSVVFDREYFDVFHITLNLNGQSLTLIIDDEEDRTALLLGLDRALDSL